MGAALNGLEDQAEPPQPITGNAYALELPQVPSTWSTAIDAFEKSPAIRRIFHEDLMRNLVLTKRQEVFYMADVTPQEQVEIYLDTV